MSEMVERIARALCANAGCNWDSLHETETTRFGMGQEVLRSVARAAIAAMREPTAAMLSRPYQRQFAWRDEEPVTEDDMREIWQAMIDEALKPDVPSP